MRKIKDQSDQFIATIGMLIWKNDATRGRRQHPQGGMGAIDHAIP